MNIETEIEAAEIRQWFHCNSPQDNEAVAATLAAGLVDAKASWHAARVTHDLAAEQAASEEWADLILLLGAAVDGLRAQRRTIAGYDQPKATVLYLSDW